MERLTQREAHKRMSAQCETLAAQLK